MLYMCTSCNSDPFEVRKSEQMESGDYLECQCGELALPLSKFRDALKAAMINCDHPTVIVSGFLATCTICGHRMEVV